MAERYMRKRKLKKRFLLISSISKFLKKNGPIVLLIIVFVVGVCILYFKPEPEPEPNMWDKMKQSTESIWIGLKSRAILAWSNISGFFGNLFK